MSFGDAPYIPVDLTSEEKQDLIKGVEKTLLENGWTAPVIICLTCDCSIKVSCTPKGKLLEGY